MNKSFIELANENHYYLGKMSEHEKKIIESRSGYPKGLLKKTEEVVRERTGH